MLKAKLLLFLFGLKIQFCSCGGDIRHEGFRRGRSEYRVTRVGTMPAVANENSGLATASGKPTFWTHNDSGGKPELYEVDEKGLLLRTLALPNIRNRDWEDISRDSRGNLYIGDTGNNTNNRQDLVVYIVPERIVNGPVDSTAIQAISYRYEDQRVFPPEKKDRNFDCEAFFFHQDSLYLFSKNRGDRTVKLYSMPARPGNQVARVQDRLPLRGMVTAADISPDRKTFAVLTYGKIFFFGVEDGKINFRRPISCLKVGRGQVEGLVFVRDNELLLTNEKGKIFRITRKSGTYLAEKAY